MLRGGGKQEKERDMSALGFVGGLAGAIAFGIYGLIAFVFFTAATLEQAERGASSRMGLCLAAMGAILWPLSLLVASLAAFHSVRRTRQARKDNAARFSSASPPGPPWSGTGHTNGPRPDAGGFPPPVLAASGKLRKSKAAAPAIPQEAGTAKDAGPPSLAPPVDELDSRPEAGGLHGSAPRPRTEPATGTPDEPQERKASSPDSFLSACAHHLAIPTAIGGAIVRSLAPLQMQPQPPFPKPAQERNCDNRARIILSPRQYQGDSRQSDSRPSGHRPGIRHGKPPRKGKQG
jgi:hypothetical protein